MKNTILFLFLLFEVASSAQPDFVWAKQMGGAPFDIGASISIDASGNVYTTGCFEGNADFDPGSGNFNLTAAGTRDIFISKLDASGNFVWAKRIGGTGDDVGQSITVDASDNVYTTGWFIGTVDLDPGPGTFYLTSSGYDTFISKLDASGNFVWAKTMKALPRDIAIDAFGNVFTTGAFFSGTKDFDPGPGIFNLTSVGSDNIWISKLDSSGSFVWAKNMGGTAHPEANSIAADASGNIYITGYCNGTTDFDPGTGTFNLTAIPSDYNYDIFIVKLDASGNFAWAKSMGGSSYDIGRSITLDSLGNIYTTGSFNGTADFDPGAGTFNLTATSVGSYNDDIFISKLDSSGNFVWAKSIGGPSSDISRSIAVDVAGDVYTTGFFDGIVDFDPGAGNFNLTSTDDDIFISKIDASGNFVWAKNMGGTFVDQGYSIIVDAENNVYTTGMFNGTADFDPGAGIFNLTSAGSFDIFVNKLSQTLISVGMSENTNMNNITIYPNPTTGTFQINYSSTEKSKLQLNIFNFLGEKIYSETVSQPLTEFKKDIDLSKHSKGIYFVEIIADKKKSVKKIVLN